MKKFILFISVALASLLAFSCEMQEPTSVEYKYTSSVEGKVIYQKNGKKVPKCNVSVVISGTPLDKITVTPQGEGKEDKVEITPHEFNAVTNSDGEFKIEVACSSENGIIVKSVEVKEYRLGDEKYSCKSTNVDKKIDAGDSGELDDIKIKTETE